MDKKKPERNKHEHHDHGEGMPNPFKMKSKNGILLLVFLGILIATTIPGLLGTRAKAESYNHFRTSLSADIIEEVSIEANRRVSYKIGEQSFKTTIPYTDAELS